MTRSSVLHPLSSVTHSMIHTAKRNMLTVHVIASAKLPNAIGMVWTVYQ